MPNSLGNKIKELRKKLKLTQTELAGNEMTKSMLSQIENNTALPSMKNLHYLAAKLGKPASYFLEDENYQEGLPVAEISEQIRAAAKLIVNSNYNEALTSLETIEEKYDIDHDSKLYADFMTKYGECLFGLKNYKIAKEKIMESVTIYKNKYLYIDAAKNYLLLIDEPWNSFDYVNCMEILDETRLIYQNSILKDSAFEIEMLYNRAVLYAGLDQFAESIATIEKALDISNSTKIYYHADRLYKTMATLYILMDRYEHFEEYLEKARKYATFTEDSFELACIDGVYGLYYNKVGEPEKAISHLLTVLDASELTRPIILSELTKSHYLLGEYQKAIECTAQIEYPENTPFKYDYLDNYCSKIYEGLSLNMLGRSSEAITAVKTGIEKMEIVGVSKALALAYKTLSEIYSETGDYENAFSSLKKANDIEEMAKEKKLYY